MKLVERMVNNHSYSISITETDRPRASLQKLTFGSFNTPPLFFGAQWVLFMVAIQQILKFLKLRRCLCTCFKLKGSASPSCNCITERLVYIMCPSCIQPIALYTNYAYRTFSEKFWLIAVLKWAIKPPSATRYRDMTPWLELRKVSPQRPSGKQDIYK